MQEDALIRTTNGCTAELDVPAIDHSFRALREVDLPALRLGLGGGEQVTQFVRGAGAPPRLRARTPSAGPLRRCRGGDVGSRRGWARPGFPRQCPVTHPLAARRHLRARDPPGPLLLQPPSAALRRDAATGSPAARRGKQSRWASECDLPAASSPERTSSSPPVPAGSGAPRRGGSPGHWSRSSGSTSARGCAATCARPGPRSRARSPAAPRNERDATGERSAALGRVLAAAGGPGLAI